MTDTLSRLTDVFRDVFNDDALTVSPETTAADVPEWDSLMHVTLIVAIEKSFGIRFKSSEVAGLHNVGDLVNLVDVKTGAPSR